MPPSLRTRAPAAFALILLLASCGGGATEQKGASALASLDTRLTNGAVAAKEQATNAVSNAAPETLAPAPVEVAKTGPSTLGSLAEAQKAAPPSAVAKLAAADGRVVGGCAGRDLRYGDQWAAAMPDGLTLYPGATLAEAAGSDSGRCALRVVSFTTADSPERVAAIYAGRARDAGFDAERQPCRDEVRLGGTRSSDDAAYMLFARRKGRVTEVDIIASAGTV